MELKQNYIKFGTFTFENVFVKDFKNAYSKGVFMLIATKDDDNYYCGVQLNHTGNKDIVSLQRTQEPININGIIVKNIKTQKMLYIVDDATTGIEKI